MAKLASSCEAFAKLSMSPEACASEVGGLLRREHPDPQLMSFLSCVIKSNGCDATQQCLDAQMKDPTADGTPRRTCGEHGSDALLQAVGIPRAEWARRKGAGLTRYRAAVSTKESPDEMCGVGAANEWLETLACDDGSRPITDRGAAEPARAGSVGPGGRCGAIIDHYVIPCPESKYDIFIDAYICPLP